ncbi:MAG: UvrD-helicase domain-containing protein, partial [Spirochaetales bacterium]|nr:UvrD-helicase domain-containing protein [Spirochaetales bacterium]
MSWWRSPSRGNGCTWGVPICRLPRWTVWWWSKLIRSSRAGSTRCGSSGVRVSIWRPPLPDSDRYLAALNPRQREAVLHTGRPLLILAGAGSGKTRVITTKIAHLIDSGGLDPASILAVAFTNKAADEMRERVRSLTPTGAQVMVKTFHAFGAWLLRRYGQEIGIPRGFTICDEEDSFSLLRHVVQEELEGERLPQNRLKSLAVWIARAKDRCLLPEDDLAAVESRAQFPGL